MFVCMCVGKFRDTAKNISTYICASLFTSSPLPYAVSPIKLVLLFTCNRVCIHPETTRSRMSIYLYIFWCIYMYIDEWASLTPTAGTSSRLILRKLERLELLEFQISTSLKSSPCMCPQYVKIQCVCQWVLVCDYNKDLGLGAQMWSEAFWLLVISD